MTMLYQRLTSEADRKGEKKAHIMGGLMAYSQFTIFAVCESSCGGPCAPRMPFFTTQVWGSCACMHVCA